MMAVDGQLAQLVRAPLSHSGGHRFESRIAHHTTPAFTIYDCDGSSLIASLLSAGAGVLYRINPTTDGGVALLVQSSVAPDWTRLPVAWLSEEALVKDITAAIERVEPDYSLRFKLIANPTRKIDTKTGVDGRRNNGKRVELRTEAEWTDWLMGKGEQYGFEAMSVRTHENVPNVRTSRQMKSVGRRTMADGTVKQVTVFGVVFEGLLRGTDFARFRKGIECGIGPGKAYGCGLFGACQRL